MKSQHALTSLIEHDLFGKPVSTFPDNALARFLKWPDGVMPPGHLILWTHVRAMVQRILFTMRIPMLGCLAAGAPASCLVQTLAPTGGRHA